jgi:hypothetical protein
MSSLSAFLAGVSWVVVVGYFRYWYALDVATKKEWLGLLPVHVFCVAASYNLLLVYATIETYIRIGHDSHTTWRAWILIPAYLLGVAAMAVIHRRRRGHRMTFNS